MKIHITTDDGELLETVECTDDKDLTADMLAGRRPDSVARGVMQGIDDSLISALFVLKARGKQAAK